MTASVTDQTVQPRSVGCRREREVTVSVALWRPPPSGGRLGSLWVGLWLKNLLATHHTNPQSGPVRQRTFGGVVRHVPGFGLGAPRLIEPPRPRCLPSGAPRGRNGSDGVAPHSRPSGQVYGAATSHERQLRVGSFGGTLVASTHRVAALPLTASAFSTLSSGGAEWVGNVSGACFLRGPGLRDSSRAARSLMVARLLDCAWLPTNCTCGPRSKGQGSGVMSCSAPVVCNQWWGSPVSIRTLQTIQSGYCSRLTGELGVYVWGWRPGQTLKPGQSSREVLRRNYHVQSE